MCLKPYDLEPATPELSIKVRQLFPDLFGRIWAEDVRILVHVLAYLSGTKIPPLLQRMDESRSIPPRDSPA